MRHETVRLVLQPREHQTFEDITELAFEPFEYVGPFTGCFVYAREGVTYIEVGVNAETPEEAGRLVSEQAGSLGLNVTEVTVY